MRKMFILRSLIFACFFPKTRFSQLCGFSRFAISVNNKPNCNLLDLCDFTWQSWKFPVLGVVFLHFRFWDHISGFARFARFANNIYIYIVCVCVFAEIGLFHSIGRADFKSNVIKLSIFRFSVEPLSRFTTSLKVV